MASNTPPIRRPPRLSSKGLIRLAVGLGLVTGIVCLWALTPLDTLTDTASALDLARAWATAWWAPPAIALAYLIAGLVVFPLTIMIAVTGLLYGVYWGFMLAVASGLFAACVMFFLGRYLGQDVIRRFGGVTINRISHKIGDHGVTTVAVLRMTPVASFGAINLVSGASHIRFGDYVVGTLVGMVPYAFVITLFGDVMEDVLHNPTIEGSITLLAVFVGILLLAAGLDRIIRRYRQRQNLNDAAEPNSLSKSRNDE